jgi:hypothetical protein
MNRSRVVHRLFNGITALSLALFILTPIAWLRSQDQDEGIGQDQSWVDGSTRYAMEDSIEWGEGMLMVEHRGQSEPNVTPVTPGRWISGLYPRQYEGWFTHESDFIRRVRVPNTGIGDCVEFYLIALSDPVADDAVAIPLWLVAAASAILPAIWLLQYFRLRDRKREGHCRQCGYDLSVSVDRCPECGAAIPHDGPVSV